MEIVSEWWGGFELRITVTNTGTASMSNYRVSFALGVGNSISGAVWNGQLVAGTAYVVEPTQTTSTLAPGETFSFGLNGVGAASRVPLVAMVSIALGPFQESCVQPTAPPTQPPSPCSNPSPSTPVTTVYYQMTRLGWLFPTSAHDLLQLLPDANQRQYRIILAFQAATANGGISNGAAGSFNSFLEQPTRAREFVAALRACNRQVLVSVGGAKGYSTGWDNLKTTQDVETFAANVKSFVQDYGFDGVDVDFEVPEAKVTATLGLTSSRSLKEFPAPRPSTTSSRTSASRC